MAYRYVFTLEVRSDLPDYDLEQARQDIEDTLGAGVEAMAPNYGPARASYRVTEPRGGWEV